VASGGFAVGWGTSWAVFGACWASKGHASLARFVLLSAADTQLCLRHHLTMTCWVMYQLSVKRQRRFTLQCPSMLEASPKNGMLGYSSAICEKAKAIWFVGSHYNVHSTL